MSRDTDAEKTRQQKAAMDYCIAHPLDTDKCVFLPPGVSSEYPNGLPPLPKPVGPTVPTATPTEEQKQRLNGTYRPPEINIPVPEPVAAGSVKPTTPDSPPVVPSYAPVPVIPTVAPPPTYRPSCDEECLQARRQANYQTGYAVGQVVGTAAINSVAVAVNTHRKHKFCKDHPNGYWNYDDGSSATCTSINAKHEARVFSATRPVDSEFRSNADEAQALMESFRQAIVNFQGKYADAPQAQSVIQLSRSDWLESKRIYCGYYRSGEYTDLDGKEQTCDGRHVEKSLITPPGNPPTTAAQPNL